jgi:cysteinyl-tRNA synthetase
MRKREDARKSKNWEESDTLRSRMEELGYTVGDSPAGVVVQKKLL